jgi:DNA-binding response OmpR family regulator
MEQTMNVLLASRELDLLRATKFALECRGLQVLLVVREPDIIKVAQGDVDILALDVALSENGTSAVVKQIRDNQQLAAIVLILFSRSRAQLQNACCDRGVLDQVDDVVAGMFDESGLIDKITYAARRLKIEKSEYHAHASDWNDPYAVNPLEERRRDKRFSLDALVKIKGKDLLRRPFEEETSVVNLSGGGAYLKSRYYLEENTGLEISVCSRDTNNGAFDVRSIVVRTEPGNDRHESKKRRVAVRFNDDVKQNIEFHLLLARLSGVA